MTLSPPKDCPAYPSLVTVDQARQNNEPMPIQLGFDVDTKRETTSASIVAVINSQNDLTNLAKQAKTPDQNGSILSALMFLFDPGGSRQLKSHISIQ